MHTYIRIQTGLRDWSSCSSDQVRAVFVSPNLQPYHTRVGYDIFVPSAKQLITIIT